MRRIIAAGAAILMAAIGGVMLLGYVRTADQRATAQAVAGIQSRPVLVATSVIPKGTPATDLGKFAALKPMPQMAIAAGAVTDLNQVSGKVASIDIQPGEIVLGARFTDPDSFQSSQAVKVPDGMLQVSALLVTERVVGGIVIPGSTVAVYAGPAMVTDKVLVTRVDGVANADQAQAAAAKSDTKTDPTQSKNASIMVTVAVTPQQAAGWVTAQEAGSLWLALDTPHAQ
jgi:pilus assembly protein CpaB